MVQAAESDQEALWGDQTVLDFVLLIVFMYFLSYLLASALTKDASLNKSISKSLVYEFGFMQL